MPQQTIKLAKLKKHAATYTYVIMEELDPDHRDYNEVHEDIETLYLLISDSQWQSSSILT